MKRLLFSLLIVGCFVGVAFSQSIGPGGIYGIPWSDVKITGGSIPYTTISGEAGWFTTIYLADNTSAGAQTGTLTNLQTAGDPGMFFVVTDSAGKAWALPAWAIP